MKGAAARRGRTTRRDDPRRLHSIGLVVFLLPDHLSEGGVGSGDTMVGGRWGYSEDDRLYGETVVSERSRQRDRVFHPP